ncbi:MAG: endolytic transglycosylase MltG [Chloroflexi bacterium]|nr:endolytic transglycosylase MltG [Chloroflexota bacterium]
MNESPGPRERLRRSGQVRAGPRIAIGALAAVLMLGALTVFVVVATTAGALRIEKVQRFAISQIDHPASSTDRTIRFAVRSGESASVIADRLHQVGAVADPLIFRLLADYYGVAATLKAGEYELQSTMTATEVLTKLHQGAVAVTSVTILEGWRIDEIADEYERRGLFKKAEFLAALQQSYTFEFLQMRPARASLEGYLFPDTYLISPSQRPADVVEMMLRDFERRVVAERQNRAPDLSLTLHEAVTLASIIEREAQRPEERPVMASVFLNRLRRGMRLDADPTVQYAVAADPQNRAKFGYWKPQLSRADLQISSPYNTYRVTGLPPGPIANPGLASIRAVLQPATTDYLYFVARGDGGHVFARSLEEHTENVRKYAR